MGATYTFPHLLRDGSTTSKLRCHADVDKSTNVNLAPTGSAQSYSETDLRNRTTV